MGAIKGFFTGVTLTSTALYASLLLHQRHRARQSQQLQQQSLLLNSVVDHTIVTEEDAPRFTVQRTTWTETWKDRWNSEVEKAARYAYDIHWDEVGRGIVGRITQWGNGERKS